MSKPREKKAISMNNYNNIFQKILPNHHIIIAGDSKVKIGNGMRLDIKQLYHFSIRNDEVLVGFCAQNDLSINKFLNLIKLARNSRPRGKWNSVIPLKR